MSEVGMRTIWAATEYMRELENQDQVAVLDFSQSMLWDLIQTGAVGPMIGYVRQYCDVTDGPEDTQRIADEINAAVDRDLGIGGAPHTSVTRRFPEQS